MAMKKKCLTKFSASAKLPVMEKVLLSKWWQTESCAQAFARAKAIRDAKIEKLKQSVKAKKEKLEREAAEWTVVE
jgi:hypothetical protein